MNSILDLIPLPLPTITIIDLGAMALEGVPAGYHRLLDAGVCQLIGFEPVPEECEKLNERAHPGQVFLPHAVGDGKVRELRICNFPMTSSLYEPNQAFCQRFQNLAELMQVIERVQIQTLRLDDIPEVVGADYIKMDIQGAELDAIRGGENTFRGALIVETEVEFVPLYVDQPLFADIDIDLRGLGFLFHRFRGIAGRTMKPLLRNGDPNAMTSQALWADAIYVRNLLQLQEIESERLLKLAIILHEVYSSVDFCHHVLQHYDANNGTTLSTAYLQHLTTSGTTG